MDFFQFSAPAGWLLVDFGLGLIVLLGYTLIPSVYRPLARTIRWIILPYLALLTGGISPRLMGLSGINWLVSFGFGLGLIAAVLGLLLLVRSTTDIAIGTPTPGGKNSVDHITDHTYRRYSLGPIVYAGAEEFHWCFLRGALWEILQGAILQSDQAGYWAIWLAALMALPGILRFQTTLLTRLIKVILLLLTTILFVYTQNFWLCWLLHGLVILLLMPQEEMNTLSDKLA